MVAEIYWIHTAGKGRLAVMPRPRGGDWLEDEILSLKKAGLDVLVSMLTSEEETLLGLGQEGPFALRHGIQFISHPIPDRGIPVSAQDLWSLARNLADHFTGGMKIAVHCRMGIGRSPLLLACILVSSGVLPDDAWEAIGDARGCVVPDTVEQRAWLTQTAPGP